jgi:hypothetical protein
MHPLTRHFFAMMTCTMVFSLIGTSTGFARTFSRYSGAGPSLLLGGILNCIILVGLCIFLFSPIASFTRYLFTCRWEAPLYIQALFPLLLLAVPLFLFSLFFGRFFLSVFFGLWMSLALPTLLYWIMLHITGRFDEDQ